MSGHYDIVVKYHNCHSPRYNSMKHPYVLIYLYIYICEVSRQDGVDSGYTSVTTAAGF